MTYDKAAGEASMELMIEILERGQNLTSEGRLDILKDLIRKYGSSKAALAAVRSGEYRVGRVH